MGRPGVIHPHVLKKALEKSNIPVIPNGSTQATNSPNSSVMSNTGVSRVNAVRANSNTTLKQNLLHSLQTGNSASSHQGVEVPLVRTNNGTKEPIVIVNNGKITTPSGAKIALDASNILKNLQNGVPVTVNNQAVTVNTQQQLVNSKTGNPVTVLNGSQAVRANQVAAQRSNAFYSNNSQPVAANAAAVSPNQTTMTNSSGVNQAMNNAAPLNNVYSYSNYKKLFPQMTENQYSALSAYAGKQQIPLQSIRPENLSSGIDDFLAEFNPNN